jgi:hypothetical protein
MQLLNLQIPDDIDFSALELERDPDGMVSFRWDIIERICDASGIDPATFREAPEDNIAGLLVAWYMEHRARGGAPDPVEEDLIAETLAEDALGGGLSHPPGRA